MNAEEALILVDTVLAPQRLNTIQELVFKQCFLGQTYQEIAEHFGYDYDYVRVTGYRLWQALTEVLGERVTKHNFRAVLRQRADQVASDGSIANPAGIHRTLGTVADSEIPKKLQATTHQVIAPATSADGSPACSNIPEFPSGSVALGSAFYMPRFPIEQRAYAEILHPGALIRIRAPKQWGKTSLMLRLLQVAEAQGYRTVRLNLQQVDPAALWDLDRYLRWFCANLSQQLQLPAQLDEYWDEDLGSKISCTTYLRSHILAQVPTLVIALDDVQEIFEFPEIAKNFLPLLRFWHEEANNQEIWQRLRLIVAHSTEIYIPLNLNQSPFNVGLPIRLREFTLEQVQELALQHGFDWAADTSGQQQSSALQSLLNGHPYLIRLALYHLYHGESMQTLLADAPTPAGIYGDHLLRHLTVLQKHPHLAAAFAQVVAADQPVELDTLTAYQLESMGLVMMVGNQSAPRCRLYQIYFHERFHHLLNS
ncbi:MAG: AAA-like domain-containing protein [Elainella sp. Prado103]|jgi:hypothetical protein|nr:AAA-like domain-containing protein [Elainella sp. Prado103]